MTAELTNALVAQADTLANTIDKAEDSDELEAVVRLIKFQEDVWDALGYGYKADDLMARVRSRASHLYSCEQTYLAGCRKNCSTRASTIRNIARLEILR